MIEINRQDNFVNTIQAKKQLKKLQKYLPWSHTYDNVIRKVSWWKVVKSEITRGVSKKKIINKILKIVKDTDRWCVRKNRLEVNYFSKRVLTQSNKYRKQKILKAQSYREELLSQQANEAEILGNKNM